MKLTPATIRTLTLPEGKLDETFTDDDLPGLGLRIRAGGSKTWVYRYKIGSRFRRITIGSATAISLPEARKRAAELHIAVRAGRDPAGEKEEGRARAAETMGAALAAYLPFQQGRLKPGSYDEVRATFRSIAGSCMACNFRRSIAAPSPPGWPRWRHRAATWRPTACAPPWRRSLRGACERGWPRAILSWGREGAPERSRDRVLSLDELRYLERARGRRLRPNRQTADPDGPARERDRRALVVRGW